MILIYGIAFLLILLVITALVVAFVWFLIPAAKPAPAKKDVKTQPIVQSFISDDLKKRAFVIRFNEGGFKVIYQRYSEEVINQGGEVVGWQALPEKPVTESLASAIEIAKSWAHTED